MAVLVATIDIALPELLQGLLGGVVESLNRALIAMGPGVRRRTADAALARILDSPEYESLVAGDLRAQLGLANPEPVATAIAAAIQNGIQVDIEPVRALAGNLSGGMTVSLLRGDLSEVLGVEGASFVSEHGFAVDWLKWLLTAGDAIVLVGYRFLRGSFPRHSRTGLGIMAKGGSWRVPAEFAGTEEDNWLTRALAQMGPDFEAIFEQELQARL
jgi:hypothetical protein